MSVTPVDNYFPFTTGPGAAATQDNWRLMARNWVQGGSGIIYGTRNQFKPTMAGTTVTVDTGAAWLDGFYGENITTKTITAGGTGQVVVQMDPTATPPVINIAFKPGQTTPVQQSTGVFEIPIANISGTTLTDVRQYVSTTASVIIPTGVMVPFAGNATPIGWLLCDGRSLQQSSYPALYSAIGTTFGGTGTTFNLPDTRSRLVVGASASAPGGLTQRNLGAVGGSELLSLTQLPSHQHTTETVPGISAPAANGGWLAYRNDAAGNGLVAGGLERLTFTPGVNSNAVGGGQPYYPPYIALNQIIKT